MRCRSCSADVLDTDSSCPRCGAQQAVSDLLTGTAPHSPPPRSASPSPRGARSPGARTPSSLGRTVAAAGGRFVPGEVVAERYRIVGLLGRGGMGEVYRADDLKLDHPVALKFLPAALQDDPERLDRFYGEVRLAREVSHPSVCRVYDLAEAAGTPFLSMEYVDGEDLASLLRRIGRLPGAKALEIARQLCAGLAAAHQKGVLHRDLKPENVMIDGRGHVRITDFGLAVAVDGIAGHDVRSGTPAYMSPEQRAGREVTVRSEVYALGLVLYELFTGRKAYEAASLAELERKQREEIPVPSELVPDIDPAVERTILRCLAVEPRDRPPSALAVSAALPGGDPLAAALAAGETPSPQLVAAGRGEALRPATALLLLLFMAAVLPILPWLGAPMNLAHLVPIEKAPAVLEDRARELLHRIGHVEPPRDAARGLAVDSDYVRYVVQHDRSPRRWDTFASGPPVLQFWYRQSPRALVSTQLLGRVFWASPPQLLTGMAGVRMDMRGRLVEFYAVPPQLDTAGPAAAAEPDWSVLFAEAGLDPARLQPAAPQWTPISYADTRKAWEGTHPERSDMRIRVEAAGYRGRPVSFEVLPPWARPERMMPSGATAAQRAGEAVAVGLLVAVVIVAGLLARRHVASGRGDLAGALRLAEYMVVVGVVAWLLWCDHVMDFDELNIVIRAVGATLLLGLIIWTMYLALEPFVRRRWPQTLISWTRLLGGAWRDPLVGRDVLIGCVGGVFLAVCTFLVQRLSAWTGHAAFQPQWRAMDLLLGPREVLAEVLYGQANAVGGGLGFLLLLVLFRQLFRRLWPAVGVVLVVFALPGALSLDLPLWVSIPLDMVLNGVAAFVLVRFGLLAAIVLIYVVNYLLVFPLTSDLSSWTAAPMLWGVAVLAVLALYGYRTALAGRSPFAGTLPAD